MADVDAANTLSGSTIAGPSDDKPAVLIIGGLGISSSYLRLHHEVEHLLIFPDRRLHRPLPGPLHPPQQSSFRGPPC